MNFKLLQAQSDETILHQIRDNIKTISMNEFVKAISLLKQDRNLRRVPKVEVAKENDIIQAISSLGQNYFYIAITQSFNVQGVIGGKSFEFFGANFKNQNLVSQLQRQALQMDESEPILSSLLKKKPTLFSQLAVQLINTSTKKIQSSILQLLAPYLQYSSPSFQFVQINSQFLASNLVKSYCGQLGKDDIDNKLNILDILRSLPLQSLGDLDLVQAKSQQLLKLPKFQQFSNKISHTISQLYPCQSLDSIETIMQFNKTAVSHQEIIQLQNMIANNILLSQGDSEFVNEFYQIYLNCILKTQQVDTTSIYFLTSFDVTQHFIQFVINNNFIQHFKCLIFSQSQNLFVQFLKIYYKVSIDTELFNENICKITIPILLDVKNQFISFSLLRIFQTSYSKIFIKTQLELLEAQFTFSQLELEICQTLDVVQQSKIPAEIIINKSDDLKAEQFAKQSNKARLQIIEDLKIEESAIRESIKNKYMSLFESFTEINKVLRKSKIVYRSFFHHFLAFLIKVGKLIGQSLGIDKYLLSTLSLYLSVVRNKITVSGIESQPILVNLLMKYLFGEQYKIKNNNKYKFQTGSYFMLYNQDSSIQTLISQAINLYSYNSFDQQAFQQFISLMQVIVSQLDQMQKIQITKYLNSSYEILSKTINCVDDFEVLQLVFLLSDTNQYTLMRIVQNIIQSYKIKGNVFDKYFMTPIINNLVTKADHSKQLAYQTLSHIPTSQKIMLTHDLQFKLLLAEYLGDSVRRFFLSSGDRISYIEHLQNNIQELFEDCFNNYNQFRLELLPSAVQAICEQVSTKQFIQNVTNKLLQFNFYYSINLEDSRFDINSQNSMIRKCIWQIFEKISKQIMSFDGNIFLNLPIGLFATAYSSRFPSISEISPDQEQDQLNQRIQLVNDQISGKKYKVVDSIYTQQSAISMLKQHDTLNVEVDPINASIIQTIVERFLHNGIFEYDNSVLNASKQSVISIIEQMGTIYNQQITYLLETNRESQINNVKINPLVYYIIGRLIKYQTNLFNYGIIHQYTIDTSQLKNKVNDAASNIIDVLGAISSQLLFEDKERGIIINFIELCTQHTNLDINDKLAISLQNIWKILLTCQSVKQATKAQYPHQKFSNGINFAKNYLLPRYIDTVKFQSEDFPGSVFCLVGVIQYLGLSYVYQRENIIENVGCYCLRQQEVQKQQLGIVILQSLIKAFGKLIEPYYILFIEDILYLSSSDNIVTQQLCNQLQNILLKNLSLFGISCVMNSLVNALTNDVDWQLKKGACDLVYNLSSNSAKIPLQQFRLLMARMLPVLLPALQPNIYHSHLQVKNSALKTIEKVADSVQSSQVKQISRKIIDAYSQPLLNRQILVEVTNMTFTSQIDAASLTLIYPICDRVLSASSSTIYSNQSNQMKDTHTKVIGCSCVILLSKISKQTDFKQYIPRLISLLKDNLSESNDEIRTSAANTLSHMLENYQIQSQSLELDLWKNIAKKLDLQRQHGISLSIVNLSFQNNTWDQLIQRLYKVFNSQFNIIQQIDLLNDDTLDYEKINPLATSLFLLYLPQKIIELEDATIRSTFVSKYLQACFDIVFQLVQQKAFVDQSETLYKTARQISTSFLKSKFEIKQILNVVIDNLMACSSKSRFLAISIIGDIISELGATESQDNQKQVSQDLQSLRDQLLQVSFQKDEKRDVKVFIPEQSLGNAMNAMGSDMYYKLMGNLFLARCDDTSGIRNASVSMWKLVTIKPVTTILGFLPYIFDEFQFLLMQHYKNVSADLNYKVLVSNGIKELMISLQSSQFQSFVDKIYEHVNFENNFEGITDEQLYTSLDLFSFIAKSDAHNQFIHEDIVNFIPRLLTESKNEIVINSAAQLLTSLNADVTQLLESLINPQIEKLLLCTSESQIIQIVNSVMMITTTKPQVQSLLEFSLIKNQINSNTIKFFELIFQQSTILQSYNELLIDYCVQRIKQDNAVILDNSKTVKKVNGNIFVHHCIEIIYNCLNNSQISEQIKEDIYDKVLFIVFDNIQSTVIQDKILAISFIQLLCQVYHQKAAQNPAFVLGCINIIFMNTNNQQLSDFVGITINCLYMLFDNISSDTVIVNAFVSLFIPQFYQNLKRIVPMMDIHDLFLTQINKVTDIIKILCFVLPTTITIEDSIKYQALKSILIIILITLQSYSKYNNIDGHYYDFDDLQFYVCLDKVSSQNIFAYCTLLIGRVVLTLKTDPSDNYRINIVDSIYHVFSLCQLLGQLEPSIRIDLERRCLITKNKQLQIITIKTLHTLFKSSLRKESNIMSLLSIIFTPTRQLHQLDHQTLKSTLKTLQLCLHNSNLKSTFQQKPNELIISEDNLYEFIAYLVFEQIILGSSDQEVIQQAAFVCAEAILAQELDASVKTFTTLILNQQASDYFPSQINIFNAILIIGIDNNAPDKSLTIIQKATGSPFKFLEEKLAFCPDSALVLLSYCLSGASWLVTAHEKGNLSISQSLNTFSKLLLSIFERYTECSIETKKCALKVFYNFEKIENVQNRTNIGVISINMLQKMLLDPEIGFDTQAVVIEFFRLRVGPIEFENVYNLISKGDIAVANDMKHRIDQMLKQIKTGKI